jgi:hypothetical protein
LERFLGGGIMRFFLICLGVFVFLFFVSSSKLKLYADDLNEAKIYYFWTDENGTDDLRFYNVSFLGMFHVEHQAFVIFKEVFGGFEPNTMLFTPKNVEIHNIQFFPSRRLLKITLSKNVLNYGGTYFEHKFVKRLLKNAEQLECVDFLTISVEGNHELVYISSNYLVVPNRK